MKQETGKTAAKAAKMGGAGALAGCVASNGKKQRGKTAWKTVTKGGCVALRAPDGRYFYGTAAEVRTRALMPWQRDMLAQSLKLQRFIHERGTYTDGEYREICAGERQNMIRYGGTGAVCVEIPAAVYIQLCAGARLVAGSTEAYFAKMWESEIEGLLDVAQAETGKREIPMTRHERRAFERLRETSRA